MDKKLIGLSVSSCVLDMAVGKIDPASVGKIIARTRAATPKDWEEVIEIYKRNDWSNIPDVAEKIIRLFIAEGRVEQPRLVDNSRYPRIWNGHWVESVDQIEWSNE